MIMSKQCSTCKVTVNDATKNCPKCGKKIEGSFTSSLFEENAKKLILFAILITGSISGIVYLKHNQNPVHSNHIAALDGKEANAQGDKALTSVIDNQLQAFKSGNLDKALSYFTKPTQENVTPEVLKEFVSQIPILTTFKSVDYSEPEMAITVTLTDNNGKKTEVDYRLGKENGDWQIISFDIKNLDKEVYFGAIETSIRQQVKDLKAGKYKEAYAITTKDFQKNTSLEDYKKFGANFKDLGELSFGAENYDYQSNFATVIVHFAEDNGDIVSLRWELVKEDNQWKTQYITDQIDQ